MAIPKNKIELLQAIEDSYNKLEKELVTIPVELTEIPELLGHKKNTTMSLTNLIAYLVGWGELVLKWNRLDTAGEKIDFPDTGFKWTELGDLAQKFYRDYEKDDFPSLLKKLEATVEQILNLVEKLDNETLYLKPWYNKYPFGRMIQLNTSSPYKNAKTRIRTWKKAREKLGLKF